EPAARAVDRLRHEEHGDAEREARHEQGRRERPEPSEVEARGDDHQPEPEQRVRPLALQELARVVAAERRRGRRRAVDHDEPEGDEAERDEYQYLRLETPNLHPRRVRTRRVNSSPRCSKSRNWSKLAAAGERSTTSPGTAAADARSTARSSVPAVSLATPTRSSSPASSAAVSPTSTAAFTRPRAASASGAKLSPLPRPPATRTIGASIAASARSAAPTFVAFE